MTDVFISYKREEREAARRLAQALGAHGLSVWWDAEILPGEQYRAVTLQILESCKAVIVIWSPQSIKSGWVLDESQRALDRGVLIPVKLEPIPTYPLGFGQLHAHDLVDWDGGAEHAALKPVLAAIHRLGGGAVAEEPAPVPHANVAEVEAEVAFWRGVQDSKDRDDLEAYLARYPQGLFADLARRRIDALAETPKPARKRAPRASRKPPPAAAPRPEPTTSSAAAARAPEPPPRSTRPPLHEQYPAQPAGLAGSTARHWPAAWAPFTRDELIFIAVMLLLAPFPAWPIVNYLANFGALYFESDFALLLRPTSIYSIYYMVPLLAGFAWVYDRLAAMWAMRPEGRKRPHLLLIGFGVLITILFALSLGEQKNGGVEAHFCLWLAAALGAALGARRGADWARTRVPALIRAMTKRSS